MAVNSLFNSLTSKLPSFSGENNSFSLCTMAQTSQQRVYDDFKPLANWVKQESSTLEVHLHEFKKDQLKVQLDNHGNLKLSGERPVEGLGNKWSRFKLQFSVSKNINDGEIQAKFSNGILYVTLPTKTTRDAFQEEQEQEPAQVQEKLPLENNVNKTIESKTMSENTGKEKFGGFMAMMNKPKLVPVSAAIVITVVVALGIYALYRLRSSSSSSE